MRRCGEFILKYRIFLALGILGLTILFFLHLPKIEVQIDETTVFSKNDPTLVTYDHFLEIFEDTEFVAVAYTSENPFAENELKYLASLTKELEKIPYVSKVISLTSVDDMVGTDEGLEIRPLVDKIPLSDSEIRTLKQRIELNPFFKRTLLSEDHKTIGIILNLFVPEEVKNKKIHTEIAREIVIPLRKILANEQRKSGKVFHLGGGFVTEVDVGLMIERDIKVFFFLSLLLMMIMLFLIFRNIPAVLFPIMSVVLALIWTLGMKGMFNSFITPLSAALFNLIMIISIANSVHIISHYRLELPRFNSNKDALLETYQRKGKPCLFASLTTAAGFGSLGVSPIPAIRNFGLFAAFGIMCAFFLTMIIVPSALLLIKEPSKIREPKRTIKIFEWIGHFIRKNSLWILISIPLVILIMGIGLPKIRVESSYNQYLKKGTHFRKDIEFLDEKLGGISNIEIILHGRPDSFKNPKVLQKIETFQKALKLHPRVLASHSLADYLKLINKALNGDKQKYFKIPKTKEGVAQSLLLYELSGGTRIKDYATLDYDTTRISLQNEQMTGVERAALIKEIKQLAPLMFKEFKLDITGFDELVRKGSSLMIFTQIQSLGLSAIIIFGMMMLIFGFRGGLATIPPNIFPIAFIFGLMGYAHFYLNLATVTIAAIALGLIIDDTIHYFSHFKHEFEVSGKRETAMKEALKKIGGALCYTSLILTSGFLVFLFSETAIYMDFAILSSAAVVAALIGDLIIAPALLTRVNIFKRKENIL